MKTKKIKFSAIVFLLLLVIVSSCKKAFDDKLNVNPRDMLTDAGVWTDKGTADVFLNDVYGQLPDGNNWDDLLDNWSDNSMSGFPWRISRTMIQQANYIPSTISLYSATVGPLSQDWNYGYKCIRKCNMFIKNVADSKSLPSDYKIERLAEVGFLRAFFYHYLWMTYGGVPIITEPDNFNLEGDSIFHARNTFDETFKFIDDELGRVVNDLPIINDPGRITKGAALALKGWCELFAASPRNNIGNDKSKWALAAATFKKIMDMDVYELYFDYQTLFLSEGNNNKEGILYRQYIPRVKGGMIEGLNGPTFTKGGAETSWGGVNPTQELVDSYDMDNGLPISDPASGYDSQHPYIHRERRFYQSIVYDGSFWYNDTIYTRQGIGSPNEIDLSDKNDGGQTGYYLRKRLSDKIVLGGDNWGGRTSGQNYYIFRYAEVLLSYAEAQNEAVGPDASVYDAINRIRVRAQLPGLPLGLSQDKMRAAIWKERRVELAIEDKRYSDLIRWNIAHINLNQLLHGMLITSGTGGKLEYEVIPIPLGGDRKFDPVKNYLFPIPQSAIDQNPKLKQNPNY